jgi:nicotinamidase/pyrazinamidase
MTCAVNERDALLIVDVQNDFLPGGSLGVPRGDGVIAPLNRAIALFTARARPVFASRDWHPARHCSFREQGGPWPPHCVVGTPGADFAPGLALPASAVMVFKATRADEESYSVFGGTGFEGMLRAASARRIVVGGLATDYCVLATTRDARLLGFAVVVLSDAVRAVDVQPGDGTRALEEMARLGATFATTDELQ